MVIINIMIVHTGIPEIIVSKGHIYTVHVVHALKLAHYSYNSVHAWVTCSTGIYNIFFMPFDCIWYRLGCKLRLKVRRIAEKLDQ